MTLTVREAIKNRRSIKKMNGQTVEEQAILSVLEDAVWAPNHGMRNPWRFVVAGGERYQKVVTLLRNITLPNWAQLTEQEVATHMQKFTLAGGVVFVITPEDVRQKHRLEDFAAASAMVQNAQLLALDKGIGTCWKTPVFLDNPKFREAIGATSGERVMCMLQFGHWDELPVARERKPIAEITTLFGE